MSFDYNSGPIEVFIVSNNEKSVVNGYAEVTAVANLLAPYTRISTTQIWNTTHPSYRVQNNGKNFVHAIAICKFLSAIPESDTPSYNSLRQLIRDLIVGDQNELEDATKKELTEIKEIVKRLETSPNINNVLSDFNGLLRVLKSELLSELKDVLAPPTDVIIDMVPTDNYIKPLLEFDIDPQTNLSPQ
ncbi:capsid protein [Erinnyis ello granulovirus]|uniref:Capsid protein n=1 Tax=Erinnyis ello granulovirus TaxID=307444 RepID=A0A097DAP5_9BBAC|nr:capsid protein [Erinnyis ello granulovirus]AIS92062.1 capsid protein [Erinnyis ello granulovirus]ARX71402.1 p24 [Erinnyis ello granulovirus]ARX71532.1 p24 [Erinnyis ello granulovirus]ARX71662.1 p24 [Erinnyis ello granulovirus]ARX71792.1 p24 [Erinnyis ello granulovirus]